MNMTMKVKILDCTDCSLHETRKNIVFGRGPVPCDIMLVGEAPGANEDKEGLPFIGASGKMLELFLEEAGITREDVYITNVVKCRPPGNRIPWHEERIACKGFLDAEILAVNPRKILVLGKTALLSFKDGNYPKHAEPYEFNGRTIWPMYHPAYALYSHYRLPQMLEEYERALMS